METVSTASVRPLYTRDRKTFQMGQRLYLIRYGDTVVLVAATADKGSGVGADFFCHRFTTLKKRAPPGVFPVAFSSVKAASPSQRL